MSKSNRSFEVIKPIVQLENGVKKIHEEKKIIEVSKDQMLPQFLVGALKKGEVKEITNVEKKQDDKTSAPTQEVSPKPKKQKEEVATEI